MTDTFTDWNTAPPRTLSSGASVQAVTGDRLQVVRTRVPAGAIAYPSHSHPHEQFAVVLEGVIEFTVDGAAQALGPGGVFYFAPDQLHGPRVLSDEDVVILEVYTPPRKDYSGEVADPDPANPL